MLPVTQVSFSELSSKTVGFIREKVVIKFFLKLARLPVSPRARCKKMPNKLGVLQNAYNWAFLI